MQLAPPDCARSWAGSGPFIAVEQGSTPQCSARDEWTLMPAANAGIAMILSAAIIALAQAQYNPAWGPSPCPNGQCVPNWPPTYNVRQNYTSREIATHCS